MPQLHPLVPAGRFELSELLEHAPPIRWQPESGDVVQGTVVKIEDKRAFGQTAPVLFLLVEDRYVTIRCSGVVMRGHLERNKPNPGDMVAVRYDGMATSQSGREYASYKFAMRRAGEAA